MSCLSRCGHLIGPVAKHELLDERLTYAIIGAFFDVYNYLGFGFLENIYKNALERELRARDHRVAREVYVPVYYKGDLIGRQRIDMIVDERVVVEAKSTYALQPIAVRQLRNYLRASNLRVGLLLHFGPAANYERCVQTSNDRRGHLQNPRDPRPTPRS